MDNEVWKDVPGFDGVYRVSDYGRIVSKGRVSGGGHVLNERELFCTEFRGYRRVCLNKKNYPVHRVVAMTFLGLKDCNIELVINHIDGNKINNHVSNLEWVSRRDNVSICFRKNSANYTSIYPGVCWHKRANKWIANITIDKKLKHLGMYKNELDAATAYKNALATIA